jgi:hypothetical protein
MPFPIIKVLSAVIMALDSNGRLKYIGLTLLLMVWGRGELTIMGSDFLKLKEMKAVKFNW